MTLYEMLARTMYYQKVWIFETNAYDQNMPLFKGIVEDARKDTDKVWDFLMCEVEYYDCTTGILDIRVRNEFFNEKMEGHYTFGDEWGAEQSKRPWRYSAEIDLERREAK